MLEQTDVAIVSLVNKINDVTPHLMETFKQQLQVSYIQDVIRIGISLIMLIVCAIGLIWTIKNKGADEIYFVFIGVFSFGGFVGSLITMIMLGMDIIQMNLNPDYYIIQNYVKPLLTGGSS